MTTYHICSSSIVLGKASACEVPHPRMGSLDLELTQTEYDNLSIFAASPAMCVEAAMAHALSIESETEQSKQLMRYADHLSRLSSHCRDWTLMVRWLDAFDESKFSDSGLVSFARSTFTARHAVGHVPWFNCMFRVRAELTHRGVTDIDRKLPSLL